jgi:hypothetical protein
VDSAPSGTVDKTAVHENDGRTHGFSFQIWWTRANLRTSRKRRIRQMTAIGGPHSRV